jgi:hypothetical protein
MPRFDADLRRFISEKERDKYYTSWVKRNGMPNIKHGCINCAELSCFIDCKGILDNRVRKMGILTKKI